MRNTRESQRFCGREFTGEDLSLIEEVVQSCSGISRLELAHTVCELLEWKRASGGLKARECRDFLERLESQGYLTLPEKRPTISKKPRKSMVPAGNGEPREVLVGSVEEFGPIEVELVQSQEERVVFRELVSRHHYLG